MPDWGRESTTIQAPFTAASQALAAAPPGRQESGWILLNNCHVGVAEGPPDIVLLHPGIGVALLELDPRWTPDAETRFRQRLEAIGFSAQYPGHLPVIHRRLRTDDIPELPTLLTEAFSWQPALTLPDGGDWTEAARRALVRQAEPPRGSLAQAASPAPVQTTAAPEFAPAPSPGLSRFYKVSLGLAGTAVAGLAVLVMLPQSPEFPARMAPASARHGAPPVASQMAERDVAPTLPAPTLPAPALAATAVAEAPPAQTAAADTAPTVTPPMPAPTAQPSVPDAGLANTAPTDPTPSPDSALTSLAEGEADADGAETAQAPSDPIPAEAAPIALAPTVIAAASTTATPAAAAATEAATSAAPEPASTDLVPPPAPGMPTDAQPDPPLAALPDPPTLNDLPLADIAAPAPVLMQAEAAAPLEPLALPPDLVAPAWLPPAETPTLVAAPAEPLTPFAMPPDLVAPPWMPPAETPALVAAPAEPLTPFAMPPDLVAPPWLPPTEATTVAEPLTPFALPPEIATAVPSVPTPVAIVPTPSAPVTMTEPVLAPFALPPDLAAPSPWIAGAVQAASRAPPAAAPLAPTPAPPTPVPPTPAPAAVVAAPAVTALTSAYLRRGEALLAIGDISGARRFFERAAAAGSGAAALAMGSTFDPATLVALGARGIPPDRAAALSWYKRAAALGETAAASHIATLEGRP